MHGVARPDVSRAPRGVRLLPAPALQAPRREMPSRTSDRTDSRSSRSQSRSLSALSPLVPTCLARLAACISYRLPLFKRRVAKRLTNRLTNLSPHRLAVVSIPIAVAERLSSLVPTCLAHLAACLSYRLPLFKRLRREAPHEPPHEPQPARSESRDPSRSRALVARPDVSRASRRASLIGSRSSSAAVEKRRTNRLTNLSPHDSRSLDHRGR